MKRRILSIVLLVVALVGCNIHSNVVSSQEEDVSYPAFEFDKYLVFDKMPEGTDLECWITQEPDFYAFDKKEYNYQDNHSIDYFGPADRTYFSKKYETEEFDWYDPVLHETVQHIRPINGVSYRVRMYPDCETNASAVTNIAVEDKDVRVMSLTLSSTYEEFDKVMKANFEGITIREYKRKREALIENVTFTFIKDLGLYIDCVVDENLGHCPGIFY